MSVSIPIILLLLVGACSAGADALPVRVWQLQDYDMPHIRRLIDLAAEAQVTRIQLSHNIVMDVEEVLNNERRAADINTICGWAHARNLKVDMWTHELNGIPDHLMKGNRADLDSPKLWEFVRGKYDRLFRICPDLDGLVLTMHETAISIYHDGAVSSSVSQEARVARLIDDMAGVCESFGKDLFVRTFSYEPEELQWLLGGIRQCKSDFTVMSKCCPHDWQPYYPFSPAIGNVGGRKQVVEFDLGNEFTGLSTVPYINLSYLNRHLDYDIRHGVIGAVFRVERLRWRAIDRPNQAVIDVFTQMLRDPDANYYDLYRQWLARRYGVQAAPAVFSAFLRTEEILNKSMYVLGFWITNHSRIPSYKYAIDSLRNRTTAKWDPSARPTEQELHNPTFQTLKKIADEKDEAIALADLSIADIERARPHLSARDYADLADLFARTRAMAVVWKEATLILIGVGAYERDKSDANRAALLEAADRLEAATAANYRHLVNMAADYADPTSRENVDRAYGLVELARKTVEGQ